VLPATPQRRRWWLIGLISFAAATVVTAASILIFKVIIHDEERPQSPTVAIRVEPRPGWQEANPPLSWGGWSSSC
jgi:hypothetical protein